MQHDPEASKQELRSLMQRAVQIFQQMAHTQGAEEIVKKGQEIEEQESVNGEV